MKKRYFINSVEVTPKMVYIHKGFKSIAIRNDELIGIEHRPLTGKVIFITAKKRYKVVLWHGYRAIKRSLSL